MIEALHRNLVYVRSDKDCTATIDLLVNFIPAKKWKEYCTFQAEYKDRINVLRTEKRANPKEAGGDKIMPPMLHAWEGRFGAAQPTKNLRKNMSCAFTEKQVTQYEALNGSFAQTIKLAGQVAAAKLLPLLFMDIAYLKSFDVDWESACPALETEAAADGDDDDEIDTSAWDATDPSTIPFNQLKIPKNGKIPTALMYAAALLGVSEQRPPEVAKWITDLLARVEELKAQTASQDLNAIMTRRMTEREEETYKLFMDKDDDGGGGAVGGPAATPTRPPRRPAAAAAA